MPKSARNEEPRSIRVLVLTARFPPAKGAGSVRMAEMVAAFEDEKKVEHVTVLVFPPEHRGQNSYREVRASDKVHVVYYARRSSHRHVQRLLSLDPISLIHWTVYAVRQARKASPNIVMATVPPHFGPAIAAYFTSLLCRIPLCIDIRDPWAKHSRYSTKWHRLPAGVLNRIIKDTMARLFIRACRRALLISVVYQSIGEYLAKQRGISVPAVLIPNGVNLAELKGVMQSFDKEQVLRRNGIALDQDTSFVIHVGKAGEYYRPEGVLAPIKRLREQGRKVAYIIVGDIAAKRLIADMATSLGIDDSVFVVGDKEHTDVLHLLLASDVAFYALDNAFSNPTCALGAKVLEYIACKLPILSIAGDGSVVSGLVTRHGLGIALRWDEVERIAPALEELLDDSDAFVRHMEQYYPVFARKFDRRENNRRLFQRLWERWTTRR